MQGSVFFVFHAATQVLALNILPPAGCLRMQRGFVACKNGTVAPSLTMMRSTNECQGQALYRKETN